jgi:hypothetical protein
VNLLSDNKPQDDLGARDSSSTDDHYVFASTAIDDFIPPAATEDSGSDLHAHHSLTEIESNPHDIEWFALTNPQGSVSVSTLPDDRIPRVPLCDRAASVIVDLARRTARSAQNTFMLEDISMLLHYTARYNDND